MLEMLMDALESFPVSKGFLLYHPHPKKLVAAEMGLESPATKVSIRKHLEQCRDCQEVRAIIDSVMAVAIATARACEEGEPAWKNAQLN